MSEAIKETFTLDQEEALAFCGPQDSRVRQLQDELEAQLLVRGNTITLSGEVDDVRRGGKIIQDLLEVMRRTGKTASPQQLKKILQTDAGGEAEGSARVLLDEVPLPNKNLRLSPMTKVQKTYLDAIRKKDVVFGIGPAGTGKTYLAVALAVWHLMEGQVRRIILCRPAVEAGERLGFLPGDISAKFDPFVRPLYDALYDMMAPEKVRQYLEMGVIEIAPLAFMRGRTLNDSFVILDEGQNTTPAQMKMFLTRLGMNSKAVVTGDVTQVDLPPGSLSGLIHVEHVLSKVPGISFVHFSKQDVVRHDLVQRIVHAYEQHGRKQGAKK